MNYNQQRRKRKRFSRKGRSCQFEDAANVRAGAEGGAILLAARQVLTSKGQHDEAFVIDNVASKTIDPEKVKEIRKSLSGKKIKKQKMSALEALSHVFDNGMTKKTYLSHRLKSKKWGDDIWPSWGALQKEKLNCRPTGAQFSQFEAMTPLQSILDHTTDRIFENPQMIAKVQRVTRGKGELKN